MPPRNRKQEIVEAVLALLADTPLERMTTRQIAKALGISQPALFRHFRSRAALLEAVVDRTRATLAEQAVQVLRADDSASEQLHSLAASLFAHVEEHPGLPRLLFAHADAADEGVAQKLRHLLSMQKALVVELVQQGQAQGELQLGVDPERAATALVGTIQGTILQWQLGDRRKTLGAQARPLVELWLTGVQNAAARPVDQTTRGAGPPGPDAGSTRGKNAEPRREGAPEIRNFDVRPILASGEDPLREILGELAACPRGSIVEIIAPFHPAPLLTLLESKGHGARLENTGGEDKWILDVVVGAPAIVDLRELEAPEPLEKVLAAAGCLAEEGSFAALLARFPRLLLPHLQQRGLGYCLSEAEHGVLLLIWRTP